MHEFRPHLEVLPAAQLRLWSELSAVPSEFVLYGGTAIALHLGHRHSVDFDFFADRPLNLAALESGISFLSDAKVIQRDKNTLSALVERGGRVQVSFFGVPNLQVRAEAKDYIDMDALMTLGKVSLPVALAAAQKIYGPSFNPEITLKALSYFDDGNLRTLSDDLKNRLVLAAREVDLERLPEIGHPVHQQDMDYGL